METNLLIEKFKNIEYDLDILLINDYYKAVTERKDLSEVRENINSLKSERKQLIEEILKHSKPDEFSEKVHSHISLHELIDVELPKGYSAVIVASWYCTTMGRNYSIAKVTNPQNNNYFIKIFDAKRIKIGTIYNN